MEQNLTQDVAADKRLLVVTRILGHKEDIPGSGRWQVFSEPFKGRNDCWVSDHHIYSLIFWNELIGLVELRKYTAADTRHIVTRIKQINNEDEEEETLAAETPQQTSQPVHPTIYGECTNWQPKRMIDIREYCDRINLDKPNMFEICRSKEIILKTAESVETLDQKDTIAYKREVKFYFDSYRRVWKDIVQKYMKYQKTNIVNAGNKELVDRRD